MRLIADREQLVGTALAGFGTVAHDLFGRGQPYYNDEIPQREQDIEQAQFLLKEAGLEGATFTLSTSNVVAGMLESATVFAEQAKAAGITIELENIPADAYFAERYLKYAFAQSSWSHLLIPSVITRWLVDGAPFNETHWNRPEFDARFREAQATLDETARRDIYFVGRRRKQSGHRYLAPAVLPARLIRFPTDSAHLSRTYPMTPIQANPEPRGTRSARAPTPTLYGASAIRATSTEDIERHLSEQ
jgi:hypothetical protein